MIIALGVAVLIDLVLFIKEKCFTKAKPVAPEANKSVNNDSEM